MIKYISEELNKLNTFDLIRKPVTINSYSPPIVQIDGKDYISFCSNDYLGLTNNPELLNSLQDTLEEFGWSTAAPRLLSGTTKHHIDLENAISKFEDEEDALLFTSGYTANLGVVSTIGSIPDTEIFTDRFNHASLVDGVRLSKAHTHIYNHCDVEDLEMRLKRSESKHKLIITDGVFSMDGDIAPLYEINKIANKYDARLIVDEAHGTGILGEHGRGASEHCKVRKDVFITIGTLSKALGNIGGFATCSSNLISYLRNKARTFIFTTSFPIPVCIAGISAFKILELEGDTLRKVLFKNLDYLKTGLRKLGIEVKSETPIIPIITGNSKRTVEIAKRLYKNYIYTPAIRPPTVPEDRCRLRFTVTASHRIEHLDKLLDILKSTL